MSLNIWSFIMLLGALPGLLILVFLLRDNKNIFLSLSVFFVSLHLLDRACLAAGIYRGWQGVPSFSWPLLFCTGPFFSLFAKKQMEESFRISKKYMLHFILPVAVAILVLIAHVFAVEIPVAGVWLDPFLLVLFLLQSYIYIFFTGRDATDVMAAERQKNANTVFDTKLIFFTSLAAVFTAWLIFASLAVLVFAFTQPYGFYAEVVTVTGTALFLWWFCYKVLRHPVLFREPRTRDYINAEISGTMVGAMAEEDVAAIIEKLEKYLRESRVYRTYDIQIQPVAEKIHIHSFYLSQIINREYGQSFFEFINTYRVEEAKLLLADASQPVDTIGKKVGFGESCFVFKTVFRRRAQLSPSEYRQQLTQ